MFLVFDKSMHACMYINQTLQIQMPSQEELEVWFGGQQTYQTTYGYV